MYDECIRFRWGCVVFFAVPMSSLPQEPQRPFTRLRSFCNMRPPDPLVAEDIQAEFLRDLLCVPDPRFAWRLSDFRQSHNGDV